MVASQGLLEKPPPPPRDTLSSWDPCPPVHCCLPPGTHPSAVPPSSSRPSVPSAPVPPTEPVPIPSLPSPPLSQALTAAPADESLELARLEGCIKRRQSRLSHPALPSKPSKACWGQAATELLSVPRGHPSRPGPHPQPALRQHPIPWRGECLASPLGPGAAGEERNKEKI